MARTRSQYRKAAQSPKAVKGEKESSTASTATGVDLRRINNNSNISSSTSDGNISTSDGNSSNSSSRDTEPFTGQDHDNADAMNNAVEFRRKQPPKSLADTIMSRSTFSLDDSIPVALPTPSHSRRGSSNSHSTAGAAAHGFWDLPAQDRRNFALLVLLYFLQGVPMGLATGSVPFLLKGHMSYSDIGIFSLASYPYSIKLLWSPIVDAVWSPSLGRRKSWILPIQLMSGVGMLILGSVIEAMIRTTGTEGGPTVWAFTGWWFFLVLMCATQDIAVDGWALTLLTPANVLYASTAQTVGLTAGQFLSCLLYTSPSPRDS